MYVEKEVVAQQLVNTLDIQMAFAIKRMNLAEVWDQTMEFLSKIFFLQSNQLLKKTGILPSLP